MRMSAILPGDVRKERRGKLWEVLGGPRESSVSVLSADSAIDADALVERSNYLERRIREEAGPVVVRQMTPEERRRYGLPMVDTNEDGSAAVETLSWPISKEELQRYLEEGLTTTEIANKYGVDFWKVQGLKKKYGLTKLFMFSESGRFDAEHLSQLLGAAALFFDRYRSGCYELNLEIRRVAP